MQSARGASDFRHTAIGREAAGAEPRTRPHRVRRLAVIVIVVVPLVLAAWVAVLIASVASGIWSVSSRLWRGAQHAESDTHELPSTPTSERLGP